MSENDKDSLSKHKNYYVTDFGIFIWRQIAKINQAPLIRNYSFSDITSSNKFKKSFPVIITILLFIVILGIIWKVPKYQIPNDPSISVQEKITLEDKARGTLIQVVGGLFFFVTAYFTWRNSEISHKQLIATQDKLELEKKTADKNLELADSKQITERFSKAVEQLGNEDSITVRLGGIYSLERIAKDSKKDHWTIMEILTAFVREKSKNRESGSKIPQEIQAALTVIGRRNTENDPKNVRINLSGANLNGANLSEGKFNNANFYKTNLVKAVFYKTNLVKAKFSEANVIEADFYESTAKEANFYETIATEANFYGSNLTKANFSEANLTKADFSGANLTKADFAEANLTEAIFDKVNLTKADFFIANLTKAKFSEANLTETSFSCTNLEKSRFISVSFIRTSFSHANLIEADFENANFGETNLSNSPKNFMIEPILKSKNWDKAKYALDFEEQLKAYLFSQFITEAIF
ncbi:MAG: pentapeptide repeat-containing protein [Snowella sp.]|nr:pentapeptide repeat-containing protein [Snowella sp.]